MAERPIFLPMQAGPTLVREVSFDIPWAGGFAPVQKRKNVKSLHEAAAKSGYAPLLEVSTKSEIVVGQHLSAFHLKVHSNAGMVSLEAAYQSSKVFERGGPYTDLLTVDARTAKRDPRLNEAGRLVGFEFDGHQFPLTPQTAFYDWLYLSAIYPHRKWLQERLTENGQFVGFTDIEFNPSKSINCQARSCALFVALIARDKLEEAMQSPETFISMMEADGRSLHSRENKNRLALDMDELHRS